MCNRSYLLPLILERKKTKDNYVLISILDKHATFSCFLYDTFIGCRDKVVDFHWNASDPWTIASVSDDCGSTGGGGTLQVTKTFLILES